MEQNPAQPATKQSKKLPIILMALPAVLLVVVVALNLIAGALPEENLFRRLLTTLSMLLGIIFVTLGGVSFIAGIAVLIYRSSR